MVGSRLRVCKVPGCPTIIRDGEHCPTHGRPSTQPSAGKRGYGAQWRRLRVQYLRAHPRCFDCGAPALIPDHLDGKGPSGPRGMDWSNLEPCCRTCHNRRGLMYDGAWGNPKKAKPWTTSRCREHPQCVRGVGYTSRPVEVP